MSSAGFGELLDLRMMLVTGGRERAEAEFRRPFAARGLRLTRVIPAAGGLSVVEGMAA
jgi:hypothetical protein